MTGKGIASVDLVSIAGIAAIATETDKWHDYRKYGDPRSAQDDDEQTRARTTTTANAGPGKFCVSPFAKARRMGHPLIGGREKTKARTTASGLVVAQRDHRVDAGGSAGGDVTGEKGDGEEDEDHCQEGYGVGWIGSEEEGGDQTGGCEGDYRAYGDADEGEQQRRLNDAELDLREGSAERHADSDLLGALGDGVGDDAVDSERGEDETECGEDSDEVDKEATRGGGVVDEELDGLEVGGGLAGVELAEGGKDCGLEGLGGEAGADDELGVVRAVLRGGGGDVHLPTGFGLGGSLADVCDDADDASVRSAYDGDAVDGVFVGPEVAGDGLVDDDDGLFGVVVFPRHVAAFDEAHADGVEVAGSDDVDEGSWEFVGFVVLALRRNAPGTVARHGKRVGDACGLDAGDLLDTVENLAVERGDFGCGVDAAGVVEGDGGGAGGLEAKVDVEDAEEAAQEQTRGDEEHAGEGDLRDDEGSAEAGCSLASGSAGSRIFECILQIAAGDAQAGYDAEEESGGDGDQDGPGESCLVDADA